MKLSPLKLIALSLTVSSLAFAGCAADPTSEEAEEVPVEATQDELSVLATRFVGEWMWDANESGDFVDFEHLVLNPNGTFTASVDSGLVDPGVRCIHFPCTLPQEGRWNAFRLGWSTRILIRPYGKPWRVYTAQASGGALTLRRYGNTTKLFKAPPVTCASVLCAPGSTCSMKLVNGALAPVCEPVAQPPCIKTGCSSHVCADRDMFTTCEFRPEYACYQQATCERQADGQCGFTPTPELAACLAGN